MSCQCKDPQHIHRDSQLQGFSNSQMGQLDLLQAIKDPAGTIEIYKNQAIQIATQTAVIFAGVLLVGNYLMLHQALNQKIKKIRRAS